MYDHLYNPPQMTSDNLKSATYKNLKQQSPQVESINSIYPNSTEFGVSVNKHTFNGSNNLNNDYLVEQKLRNNVFYSNLRNKIIYSQSAIAHNNLNKLR